MPLINSILVYCLFCFLLTMGLCVDSTFYKEQIAAGNILWMPMFLLTYSIPNWIGVSILATMIGRMTKEEEHLTEQILYQWRQSVFIGLTIAATIIFSGSYLNTNQILFPNQDDYFKIVSLIVLVGIGQQELKTFIVEKAKKNVNE